MKIKVARAMAQAEFGTKATVSRVNLGNGYEYHVMLGEKIIGTGQYPQRAIWDARETMANPELLAEMKINLYCEACGRG